MELALRLGRTLDELGSTMSALEFELWCEYRNVSPWDSMRGDLQAGIVCATIANYAGMQRAEDAPAAKPSNYMPFLQAYDSDKTAVVTSNEPDPVAYFTALG